jgi:Na+/melibiose symporter-like transporter
MVPIFLRLAGTFPANGAPNLVPILFAFSAFSQTLTIGASILIVSMLADVVEASELATGRRSEGLFFAGSSLLQKVVSGFGLFASGGVLWFVGFPDNAVPGHVDPAIVNHFVLVYVPLVIVLFVIGMIIMWFFPITRESHAETLRTLAAEVGQAAPQEPA